MRGLIARFLRDPLVREYRSFRELAMPRSLRIAAVLAAVLGGLMLLLSLLSVPVLIAAYRQAAAGAQAAAGSPHGSDLSAMNVYVCAVYLVSALLILPHVLYFALLMYRGRIVYGLTVFLHLFLAVMGSLVLSGPGNITEWWHTDWVIVYVLSYAVVGVSFFIGAVLVWVPARRYLFSNT